MPALAEIVCALFRRGVLAGPRMPSTRSFITMRRLSTAFTLAALAVATPSLAAVTWDETLQGDLSNDGLVVQTFVLAAGSNQVLGSTGRDVPGGTVDRDYFGVDVPTGHVWTGMTLLPGSGVIGGASFVALQAGSPFTVPPSTPDASGLMGWWLYGSADVGSDLLPLMAVPSFGSSGFALPLPAGTYSLWVQETGVGSVAYGFDLQIQAVPEAPMAALWAIGLVALAGGARRQFFSSASSASASSGAAPS
jgi:hypothetical protein